jgi:hypothetical protein
MAPAQPFHPFDADVQPGLAQELVGEQTAAHADLAMDAPDREVDALAIESLLPGQYVLIDAVNQGAVKVEQKRWLDAHRLCLLGRGLFRQAVAMTDEAAMAPAPAVVVNRNSPRALVIPAAA